MTYNKVFGIGFHKTGTTSLAMALTILGFKHNRGLDNLNRLWGKDHCVKLLKENNLQPFFDFMKSYNSTADNPWYFLYQELDKAFPNSKFVLTIRDEDKWLNSSISFFKDTKKPIHELIYGVNTIKHNEALYLQRYRAHIEEVKSYFKNRPNDLLIVDWEKESGWERLCTFLDKPLLNLPFPHLNKGKYKKELL
jgi:hypothetical protein